MVSILLEICMNSFSQYKKNAVILELAGKSYYYFDISYERYLFEKFHLGIGAGMGDIYHLYVSPDEQINEYELRFPVYASYAFGKKKHHFNTEIGASVFISYLINRESTSDTFPFISIGYEFKGKSIIFRIPLYLTYVGPNEFFPAVMPWTGVSIGMLF